ncbi:MAG: O-antigen ligase family protein, partial [Acidimicrobiia bacterium]
TRLLSIGLIAGALVNAALAWAESTVNLGKVWAGFGLTDGRPFAFMANPVHLAALCVAALWLVLSREASHREPTPWLVAVALLVGATNLAGSRIALVLAALMVIGFAILLTRRKWWIHAGVLVAVATVGFGLSLLPGKSGDAGNSRVVSAPTSGIASRIEIWEHAAQATFDRPLLGWGPGRSYQATTPLRSVEAARSEGPEIIYRDMHNFLVEVLVGTGFLGFLAFGGWLVTASRRARGPLAGFAAVGAAVLMVQPALFMFAPLLTLALGAASADGDDAVRISRGLWSSRSLRIASTITVVIGLGAGVWLLAADSDYYRATTEQRLAPLDSWASKRSPWPEELSLTAKLWDAQATVQPTREAGRNAIRAERDARDRDPYDPRAWVAYGVLQQKWGSRAEARRAYVRSLQLNPWGVQALRNLLSMEAEDGDVAGVKRYRATLCEIGPDWCPSQAQVDASARAGTATGG